MDAALLHSLIDLPFAEHLAFALMLLPAMLAVAFIATLGRRSAPRWSRHLVPGSVHRAVRIGLLLLAIVPPAVITLMLVDDAQHRDTARAERQAVELSRGVAQQLDATLSGYAANLATIANGIALDGDAQIRRAADHLLTQHAMHREFLTMAIANAAGRVLVASRLVDGVPRLVAAANPDVADRDYFRLPMSTATSYVSGVFRGPGLEAEPIAAVSAPIVIDGTPRGIVEGSFDVWQLGSLETLRVGLDEASIVVLDSSGVVVHAGPETGVQQLNPLADSPLRAGLRTTEGRIFRLEFLGAPTVGARARSQQGWQVLVLLKSTSLVTELLQVHDVALKWLLASLGVAALLAYALGKGIGRPLDRLQDAVRSFDSTRDAAAFGELRGLPDEYVGVFRRLHRAAWRLDSLHRTHAAALAESERLSGELRSVLERRESEVRERTRELAEALTRAERATAAKGEFLARMSHEIRTPMNGMVGMLDAMSATPLDATQADYLSVASQSAEALLAIIDDILDFEKAQAGKLAIERVPFDLHATIHAVMNLWKPRARGLAFVERVAESVPRSVNGDPTRLAQVLGNLVSNALKFTHQGSIALEVAPVEQQGSRARVRFRVTDTGIGMTPEVQAHLFTAFMQADGSISRRYGGTGLGLAISQELVEMMGGQIRVASEAGVGTTFEFELDYEVVDAAPGAEAAFIADVTGEYLRHLRLLVVDDNEINRKVAQTLLMQCGVQPLFAENGEQALAIVRTQPLDVILMDCHMPVLDGFRATTLIREWERAQGRVRLNILGVSASALEEDRRRCTAAGMNGFLAKPLRLAALRDALTREVASELTLRATRTLRVPVLDAAHVAEMRAASGAQFDEFVAQFARDGAELLDILEAAVAGGDFAGAHRAAHKLKGSALALGAWRLAADCAAIDERAGAADVTLTKSDVATVRAQFGQACTALIATTAAAPDFRHFA